LDSRALRADVISLNSAKIYGPKGIGILMKRQDVRLTPTITGGGQESGLRSGTEDIVKIVGAAQAVLEASNQREGEVERLRKIQSKIFEELLSNKEYEFIKIVGPDIEDRSPNNLNLIVDGFPSDEMVIRLDYSGYQVSHKSACASDSEEGSYVLEALGYSKSEANNNIRITMGRSTTLEDMQALLIAMREIYIKYKN
jgi:cysteine desulfurase